MKARQSHDAIVEKLALRHVGRARHSARAGEPVMVELAPLSRKVGWGVWVWVVLLGADVAYEIFAFVDGSGHTVTISSVVRGLVRSAGLMGVILCTAGLFGAAFVLALHWAFQLF